MDKLLLCRDIKSYILEHFDLKDKREATAICVWALGTYVYDVFDSYPRLVFYGPKQSGKSKMLTFLSLTCNNSQYTIIPSTAAMFRIIQKWKPTLILDEFNLYSSNENKEVVAILRQGYKKGGKIPRCEKLRIRTEDGSRELQEIIFYDVFCPIAFAGLTIADDQLLDRCISINLVRSNRFEIINNNINTRWFNKDKIVTWEGLRNRIEETISKEKVEESYNQLGECYIPLSGRDWELWSPLLAVMHYLTDGKHSDLWDELVEYMTEYVKKKQEEDLSSFDLRIVAELGKLGDISRFQASDVAEIINQSARSVKDQVSSHSIGHALKRLGISYKVSGGKKYYSLTDEEYKLLKQRFGINDE